MFYSRFKPNISIYIITGDKVFSNQLLLKLEDETDAMVFQDSNIDEFFDEIQSNPVQEGIIPIIIVDSVIHGTDNPSGKDGIDVIKEIREIYPEWEILIMSDMSSPKIKDSVLQQEKINHIYKNDNTGARLINRIHQIQNKYYLNYKKKMFLTSVSVFLFLIAVFFISRAIFYYFD